MGAAFHLVVIGRKRSSQLRPSQRAPIGPKVTWIGTPFQSAVRSWRCDDSLITALSSSTIGRGPGRQRGPAFVGGPRRSFASGDGLQRFAAKSLAGCYAPRVVLRTASRVPRRKKPCVGCVSQLNSARCYAVTPNNVPPAFSHSSENQVSLRFLEGGAPPKPLSCRGFWGTRLAEVDGNRTRRMGIAHPNRFEGGGAHQVLRHLPVARQ